MTFLITVVAFLAFWVVFALIFGYDKAIKAGGIVIVAYVWYHIIAFLIGLIF